MNALGCQLWPKLYWHDNPIYYYSPRMLKCKKRMCALTRGALAGHVACTMPGCLWPMAHPAAGHYCAIT